MGKSFPDVEDGEACRVVLCESACDEHLSKYWGETTAHRLAIFETLCDEELY